MVFLRGWVFVMSEVPPYHTLNPDSRNLTPKP